MTDLTICIPTVPGRESLLSRLLFGIEPQITNRVEVLISPGTRPMGDKLNEMFDRAAGRFVVAVDDDDTLAPHYVRAIGHALGRQVDFIGYRILWLEDGRFAGIVRHDLIGDTSWRTLERGVSPKCPIRTELARKVRFGNTYSADQAWSRDVHELCGLGAYVPETLYIYDHWNAHMVGTDPKQGKLSREQRDVGVWPYSREWFTWLD